MPRTWIGACLVLALSQQALAADGVIEISHARALVGAITPTDTPGYPISLGASGSYRLTSDLIQPDAATNVVAVQASNVSLDLNGFAIRGPFTCPGSPPGCANAGLGYAIMGANWEATAVTNGVVFGTARGLLLADACYVADLRVNETTNVGIQGGESCVLSRVVVTRNRAHGVSISSGTISHSSAFQNGGIGFLISSGGTFDASFASENGGAGFSANSGATFAHCTARDNVSDGIFTGTGSTVVDSSAYSNDGDGIQTGVGSRVQGSTARGNTGFALRGADLTSYRDNAFTLNSSGAEVQVGVVVATDTLFNFGGNVCGTDTVCP